MNSLAALSPVEQQKSASQRVGDQLRDLIASGNLRAGERIPSENELARALQVSRPVVREALRGLSMLGLVESRQGGGCFVTDLTADRLLQPLSFFLQLHDHSLEELFRARALIDRGLAEDAARNASREQIEQFKTMVGLGFDLVDDPVGFRVMDAKFHALISEAADNSFLTSVSQSLYSLAMDSRRRASEMKGVLQQSARDHEAIMAAISKRDVEAAGEAMNKHVEHIRQTTLMAEQLASQSETSYAS
ncbi:MAG: FadR/GntR family transcriptional regulator [Hyphomicrobiales bacterium]|jgi:GntR family transcriptional repressor for pyruvate dehydrogenase complex